MKIDKKAGTGHLNCKVCGQNFMTGTNCQLGCSPNTNCELTDIDLSAPVDVYSAWIDACDAVADQGNPEAPDASDEKFSSYAARDRETGKETGADGQLEDDGYDDDK